MDTWSSAAKMCGAAAQHPWRLAAPLISLTAEAEGGPDHGWTLAAASRPQLHQPSPGTTAAKNVLTSAGKYDTQLDLILVCDVCLLDCGVSCSAVILCGPAHFC